MKKTPLRQFSKNPASKLKKEADRLFSLYVRNNGAKNGMNTCYTCGKPLPIKKLQCGHFIARHHSATRYSEMNCKPQCVGCNVYGRGQAAKFAAHLIVDYGFDLFQELLKLGNTIHPLKEKELLEIIERYRPYLSIHS